MREKHHVTQNAISFISEKIAQILQVDREFYKERIKKSLSDNHENFAFDYETNLVLDSDSPFRRPFLTFANGSSLNRYIAQKTHYVPPEEIPIGFDAVSGRQDSVYYVPVLKTLEQVLSHENVLGDIF